MNLQKGARPVIQSRKKEQSAVTRQIHWSVSDNTIDVIAYAQAQDLLCYFE